MAPPKTTAPQLHPPPPSAPTYSAPLSVLPSATAASSAAPVPAPPPTLHRRRPRRKDDRILLSRSVGVGVDMGVSDTISAKGVSAQRDTELLQIVNLLTLAHHRNKNQHRRSRWWKELGMLRRNLRRALVLPGPVPVPHHHHLRRREKEEEKVESSVIIDFVRSTLIPRCWVAFSGLVADAQYAGLGLMLLGTLARLGGVVGLQEEEEEEEEEEQELEREREEQGLKGGHKREGDGTVGAMDEEDEEETELHQSGGTGRLGEDLGVPVAREEEEVLEAEKEDIQMTGSEKYMVDAETVAVPSAEIKSTPKKRKEKKKKKKKHRDAIDELFSGLI